MPNVSLSSKNAAAVVVTIVSGSGAANIASIASAAVLRLSGRTVLDISDITELTSCFVQGNAVGTRSGRTGSARDFREQNATDMPDVC
jgi:hypothetical protein